MNIYDTLSPKVSDCQANSNQTFSLIIISTLWLSSF